MPPKKANALTMVSRPAKTAIAANTAAKRKALADEEPPITKRGKSGADDEVTKTRKPVSKPPTSKPTTNGIIKPATKLKVPSSTTSKPKAETKSTSKAATESEPKSESKIKPKVETKTKPDAAPKAAPKRKAVDEISVRPAKKQVIINNAPADRLHVFVFGEGGNGELGLGPEKKAMNVKRPRLNPLLSASTVGVVQIATGGMHAAALTYDNQIYTWGVNDQGACGRDTTWSGGMKDMDGTSSESDSDSDDGMSSLNPKECTPGLVDPSHFPAGTKFCQLAAGDSMTFAITTEGQVYGWGTFRSNEGILGFTKDILVQRTPMLIPELSKITHLACGANHVLALTATGNVYAWGSGQQNQLGRRVVERTRLAGLTPREFGLPRKAIKYIACGGYHSFAIDVKGNVWAWGLNSYGECGVPDNAGQDEAVVPKPTKVASLAAYNLASIDGGAHHSIAVSHAGDCLVWGRADGAQTGLRLDSLPAESLVHDARGRPRILMTPTRIPAFTASFATCESDHCLAIDTAGRAWSWGFSATFQTGQGSDDDVEEATMIDNTAVRGRKLNWAGAGGQYSVLTSVAEDVQAEDTPMVNGI